MFSSYSDEKRGHAASRDLFYLWDSIPMYGGKLFLK